MSRTAHYEHLVRGEKVFFAHVVRGGLPAVWKKLIGEDKRNINSTMIVPGVSINTYADDGWEGSPIVVFNDDVDFHAGFPVNVVSGEYDFTRLDIPLPINS